MTDTHVFVTHFRSRALSSVDCVASLCLSLCCHFCYFIIQDNVSVKLYNYLCDYL